jgi:hypothetical protein
MRHRGCSRSRLPIRGARIVFRRRGSEGLSYVVVAAAETEQAKQLLKHHNLLLSNEEAERARQARARLNSTVAMTPACGVFDRLRRCGSLRVFDVRLRLFAFFAWLADVDAALEVGAVFDADALRDYVAGQRTFVADVHAV